VWTPRWVADAMAVYLRPKLAGKILDPAVGPGSLLAACGELSEVALQVTAFEIDEGVLALESDESTYARDGIVDLRLEDFVHANLPTKYDAVICNPPYVRHHRIPPETKDHCQQLARSTIGVSLDRRAGIHVYFLIKALSGLEPEGRLAFIVPADTFEGVFSGDLWRAVTSRFSLDGILTFAQAATAFPGVDTNAVIVYLRHSQPKSGHFLWMQWSGSDLTALPSLVEQRLAAATEHDDQLKTRLVDLEEGLNAGLSREPRGETGPTIPFTSLAKVVRGVATGSNSFFLMTRQQIVDRGLDEKYFCRAIARVRDLDGDDINDEMLADLESRGRPTWLLSLSESDVTDQLALDGEGGDDALRAYLRWGVQTGVSSGALVKARRVWFEMERRKPPALVFAYLGRRQQRFARNSARVVPLTGFLCVYPLEGLSVDDAFNFLNRQEAVRSLSAVGKSYGDGAIKVEPGGLRRWQVPLGEGALSLRVQKAPLESPAVSQMEFS